MRVKIDTPPEALARPEAGFGCARAEIGYQIASGAITFRDTDPN